MRKIMMLLACTALTISSIAETSTPSRQARYGTWGFDASGMNRAVRPGDDFASYASGVWYEKTIVPPGEPAAGVRLDQEKENNRRVLSVLQASITAPKTTEQKLIAALYKSYLDTAEVQKRGAAPLRSDLAVISALRDKDEVAAYMGQTPANLGLSFFDREVGVNISNPSRYLFRLSQSGLGPGTKSPYLDPKMVGPLRAYEQHAAKMLRIANWNDPELYAHKIIQLETEIARASWDPADSRDPAKINNTMTVSDLEAYAPGFPWRSFLAGAGVPSVETIGISEKSAFPAIARIFDRTPIDTLLAYLAFHKVERMAPYLATSVEQANFEFAGRMRGQDFLPPREKGAFELVTTSLVDPVSHQYMLRYLPREDLPAIKRIIENVRTAARLRIQNVSWMGPTTKSEALRKIDALKISVAYPDRWRDYSRLKLSSDDLYGNIRKIAAYDWAWQLTKLKRPVDRGEWFMAPYAVGAASNRWRLHLTFSAGILTPPNYDRNADPAVNYAGIGAIAGHEIGHLFDDQGWKVDSTGAVRDWWAPDDKKAFLDKTDRLVAELEEYEMVPGEKVNGRAVLSETMANLFGEQAALDAYHTLLGGRPAPVIDGFTGDQRFFLAFAQTWRGKGGSPDFWRRLGDQAPPLASVNTVVRNIDGWYGAFDVQPSDRLYLKPSDRAHIW